jgi:hypothetical protein
MTRVVGAQVRLTMGVETLYGTAAGGNYNQLGFTELDLGTGQDLLDSPVIGLSADRDPADPFLGQVDTSGRVTVPINEDGFGHWLRLLFGAPTTSGGAPNFVHTFDGGVTTPPSNTIQIDYTSTLTSRYSVMTGVRGGDLNIDFSPNGPALASISLIAQGETRTGTSGAGTPVAVAGTNFQRSMGSVTYNGSALGQVVGGSVRYSNNLEAVRTIRADRRIEGADPGIVAITGDLRLRLSAAAETLLADAEANTTRTLALRLQRTAQRYLDLSMGRVWLSAPKRPISGPAGIEASFSFRASVDPGTDRAIRVVLANGTAAAAYA